MEIRSEPAQGIKLTKGDEMVFIELNGKQQSFKLEPMGNAELEDFYEVNRARNQK